MSTKKKITMSVAAGAVAVAAITGVATSAMAATSTPSPSSTSSSGTGSDTDNGGKGGHGGHGRHGDGGQKLAQELASRLGVDQTKVSDALTSFREANKPTRPTGEEDQATREANKAARETALVQSLAKSLGLDEAKVKAAFTAIQDEAKATREKALTDKLAAAVKDGKLTQTEADAVKKAVDAGVVGGGFGGPGR